MFSRYSAARHKKRVEKAKRRKIERIIWHAILSLREQIKMGIECPEIQCRRQNAFSVYPHVEAHFKKRGWRVSITEGVGSQRSLVTLTLSYEED